VLSGVSVMMGRGTLAQICMCSGNCFSLFGLTFKLSHRCVVPPI
jgi:hypothetical protein